MSDDWNISGSWLREMQQRSWWHWRAVGCLASYWIYQHLGNLSPRELDENELNARVRGNQHAGDELFAWADDIRAARSGTRWSYCRDFGVTRAIFVDSRAGRVLGEGSRSIVDEEEWGWIVEHAAAGLRFRSLGLVRRLVRATARPAGRSRVGPGGSAPASIVVLSGDVHHAYLCELALRGSGDRSPIYQAVCSPYRNPLDRNERAVVRAGFTKPFGWLATRLARSAGAPDPEARWRVLEGPYFDNQVASLRIEGRTASMRLEKTVPGESEESCLEMSFARRLA